MTPEPHYCPYCGKITLTLDFGQFRCRNMDCGAVFFINFIRYVKRKKKATQ